MLDLDGNGLIGFVVMWATNTEAGGEFYFQFHRETHFFTVKDVRRLGAIVICFSFERPF